MMRHLADELTQVEGITLLSARDYRLPALGLDEERIVDAGMDCWEEWKQAMSTADAVWPIAPERDGLLHQMSDEATRRGKTLLGTAAATVALCSSKYRTIKCLQASGVPTVPTVHAKHVNTCRLWSSDVGWVVKPDDGAGAEDVILFTDREALLEFASEHPDFVVQPYFPGHPVSLSLLCRSGVAVLLACNQQALSVERGRFHYKSWVVCGAENQRSRYAPIAQAVAEAIPGLWGYVGVDLIDTGDMALVLEINPRLTTPYVGLSEAVGLNIGSAVISMTTTDALPHPRYRREVEVRLH